MESNLYVEKLLKRIPCFYAAVIKTKREYFDESNIES